MLEVKEMSRGEMLALLLRGGYGHLGCSRDNHPYVLPMNYAFDAEALYFFTTDGTKTEFIAANREVCFQVEEVTDARRSVMVIGRAERVPTGAEMERAMQLITEHNPTLVPALNETRIGTWKRPANVAVYRIRPQAIYGRHTL